MKILDLLLLLAAIAATAAGAMVATELGLTVFAACCVAGWFLLGDDDSEVEQ